jgi:hypothetical protein
MILQTLKIYLKKYLFKDRDFYIPDYIRQMRVFFLAEIYELIKEKDGAIVECGVGHGNSLAVFGMLSKNEGKDRKVFGFDTFSGFPYFDDSADKNKRYEFKDVSLQKVKDRVGPRPVLIKGTFEETLPHFEEGISLLFIDADLYQSYMTVLNNLYEKVVPGGIIAFDDYGVESWPGATRAVEEFFKDKNTKLIKSRYSKRHHYLVKP